jgi:uncharacterized protein
MIMLSQLFDMSAIAEICQQNDVSRLGLFGSFIRGEATATSDVDLLVEFSKPKSLLALIRLERMLSSAIGRKVDLLTKASLSPYLRERILEEMRIIYES